MNVLTGLQGYVDAVSEGPRSQDGKGMPIPWGADGQDGPVHGRVAVEFFLATRDDGSYQLLPVVLPPGDGPVPLRVTFFGSTGNHLLCSPVTHCILSL
jgi:hypothetical protein